MAEISKITLPSGNTYEIKDAVARQMISGGVSFIVAWAGGAEPVIANIPKGVKVVYNSTTYTGTLEGIAESVLDRADQTGDLRTISKGHIRDRHTADQTGDRRCKQKSDKCVDFGLHDQDDHDRDTDCQTKYHSRSFTHRYKSPFHVKRLQSPSVP